MKTAMQELISALTSNGLIIINQTLIDTYLEKEKEQIRRAYIDGLEGTYIGIEKYYNKRYNQNK